MLIDTHCHLAAVEFAADRDAVVLDARTAGVLALVVPSVDVASFPAVHACCSRYAGCFPAYGIHPLHVDGAGPSDLEALRARLDCTSLPPVAVGEIGLDRFFGDRHWAQQEFLFAEQLNIARELDLPVLLHVRRALDSVLKSLRRVRVPGGIVHAFNGSRQQADELLGLGFKLGFGGALTRLRATRVRQLAATLPIDSLVLETDAPDMPPCWLEGGRNTPRQLQKICEVIADLRGIEVGALARATSSNALTALPRLRLGD